MKSLLKFLGLCLLVLFFLYVWGDLTHDKHRQEHDVGVQRCRTEWKACLAKAKTDTRVNLCTADLDLCINNLP
jgi:hypothetical protein